MNPLDTFKKKMREEFKARYFHPVEPAGTQEVWMSDKNGTPIEAFSDSLIDRTLELVEKEIVGTCINPTCDQNGTAMSMGKDGEPEPEQCEYCHRERLPLLDVLAKLKGV